MAPVRVAPIWFLAIHLTTRDDPRSDDFTQLHLT